MLMFYLTMLFQTERDAWYCNIMATRPDCQKQGLGSAIIRAVCDRVRGFVLSAITNTNRLKLGRE